MAVGERSASNAGLHMIPYDPNLLLLRKIYFAHDMVFRGGIFTRTTLKPALLGTTTN